MDGHSSDRASSAMMSSSIAATRGGKRKRMDSVGIGSVGDGALSKMGKKMEERDNVGPYHPVKMDLDGIKIIHAALSGAVNVHIRKFFGLAISAKRDVVCAFRRRGLTKFHCGGQNPWRALYGENQLLKLSRDQIYSLLYTHMMEYHRHTGFCYTDDESLKAIDHDMREKTSKSSLVSSSSRSEPGKDATPSRKAKKSKKTVAKYKRRRCSSISQSSSSLRRSSRGNRPEMDGYKPSALVCDASSIPDFTGGDTAVRWLYAHFGVLPSSHMTDVVNIFRTHRDRMYRKLYSESELNNLRLDQVHYLMYHHMKDYVRNGGESKHTLEELIEVEKEGGAPPRVGERGGVDDSLAETARVGTGGIADALHREVETQGSSAKKHEGDLRVNGGRTFFLTEVPRDALSALASCPLLAKGNVLKENVQDIRVAVSKLKFVSERDTRTWSKEELITALYKGWEAQGRSWSPAAAATTTTTKDNSDTLVEDATSSHTPNSTAHSIIADTPHYQAAKELPMMEDEEFDMAETIVRAGDVFAFT